MPNPTSWFGIANSLETKEGREQVDGSVGFEDLNVSVEELKLSKLSSLVDCHRKEWFSILKGEVLFQNDAEAAG
jgi:uncharacterized cupin superfamily protein